MNCFAGTFRNGTVELAGITIPVATLPLAAPVADGTRVILGVRPEHVGLAADGAPGEVVDAVTDFLEPMGADTLGWFALAGHRISARLAPQRARAVSGPVRLALDLRHASLFAADSERRL
jgi:multiple sugar transport system ATP-binding protein